MSSFDAEQEPSDVEATEEVSTDEVSAPEAPISAPSKDGNGKIVAIIVAAVIVVAAAIGAGLYFGGVFDSPKDNPQKVAQKFVQATTCSQVQSLMTEGQYAENFGQNPCTDESIKASFSMIKLSDLKTTTKDNIAFVNGTATITDPTTKSSTKQPITLNMVKVDNKWFVDHLYSTRAK